MAKTPGGLWETMKQVLKSSHADLSVAEPGTEATV